MDQPSTDGLYETVVGDDLRDLGVPMLLFTGASLDHAGQSGGGPAEPTADEIFAAATRSGVELAGLALFGTDAYRLQRALGEQILDRT